LLIAELKFLNATDNYCSRYAKIGKYHLNEKHQLLNGKGMVGKLAKIVLLEAYFTFTTTIGISY